MESAFASVVDMLATHTDNIEKQISAVSKYNTDAYRKSVGAMERREKAEPVRFELKSGFGYDELMHESEFQTDSGYERPMGVSDSERIAFRNRVSHMSVNIADCIVGSMRSKIGSREEKRTMSS